ncbi:MAG: HPr family phosphocarrier protein [Gammaproteobacteria bacterium]|uniref:HPr family phosphocarrier protein n=1 Tax=Pseudomaricurvus alcaniphilus TaxID=1166482 RepID=UPI00140C2177|nr:HPr family phosphocarrier protein [Pseudomaricurvus alcaniphilus]MBR9910528.1 HPr family phosphocarrier protein [Gammaproteobacteria bacterium]NHN39673.1 HPr family phosphocarrier protein [Pseudomaricurvus alcaniphilus]
MQSNTVTIINKLGLHARAAAKFATTAGRFASQIKVGLNGKKVDAKSVMSLMLLAANKGTNIELEVEGSDEQEAMDAIVALINNRFDEAE